MRAVDDLTSCKIRTGRGTSGVRENHDPAQGATQLGTAKPEPRLQEAEKFPHAIARLFERAPLERLYNSMPIDCGPAAVGTGYSTTLHFDAHNALVGDEDDKVDFSVPPGVGAREGKRVEDYPVATRGGIL